MIIEYIELLGQKINIRKHKEEIAFKKTYLQTTDPDFFHDVNKYRETHDAHFDFEANPNFVSAMENHQDITVKFLPKDRRGRTIIDLTDDMVVKDQQ